MKYLKLTALTKKGEQALRNAFDSKKNNIVQNKLWSRWVERKVEDHPYTVLITFKNGYIASLVTPQQMIDKTTEEFANDKILWGKDLKMECE